MALILDLIDKEKIYPEGSAEALWMVAYQNGASMKCLDVMTRHLDRYKQEDMAVVEGDLRAECGEEGLAFARWIQGYLGFDGKLPKIDPDMWVKKRDETGRWVTTPGGIGSGTKTVWATTPGTGTGTLTYPPSPSTTSTSWSSSSGTWTHSKPSSSETDALTPWQKEFMEVIRKRDES